MSRRNWQREELLLALNLYCRLPFGQYHSHNSEIINLARFIDRTPSAVAMKLTNFASFDPYHQSRGIKGLQNTSQADRAIWEEFNANWDALVVESEMAAIQLSGQIDEIDSIPPEFEPDFAPFAGETESARLTKVRLGQQFFRKVILTSYRTQCCVCGMPIPELLVASHIVPWHEDVNLRVNPHNGLCFCAIHDKAFDRGLFTLGEGYEILMGKAINHHLPNSAVEQEFKRFQGQTITLPDKFIPDQGFLAVHRKRYFRG